MNTKRSLVAILLIALLIKVEFVNEPASPLWGNPKLVSYDDKTGIYTNRNTQLENWRRYGTPELVDKMTKPEQVPSKKKLAFSFRNDLFRDERTYACTLLVTTQSVKRPRRFVLINVEETLLDLTKEDDRQYRVWPHLGLLFVGTAAHEEGYDVILWDELVQGKIPLDTIVQPGDIVGFSLVVTGIERGMELARFAKQLGARYCIAGNDSAIFRSKHILSLPDKPIDAVFTGNSIVAIKSFFRDIDRVGIEGIRISGVETTPMHELRSNESEKLLAEMAGRKLLNPESKSDVFIVPKLDLFAPEYWNEVWSNYRNQFGHKHANPDTVRNAIALFAQGCTRTRGSDVCSYCTIAGVGDIRLPDDDYLVKTAQAYHDFGIDMVFNATDSAFEMASVIASLKKLHIRWNAMTIYGRSQGIARNPHLLDEWLSVVNDRLLINVGMDSGDADMLHKGIVKSSITDGSRYSENMEAVRRIKASRAHLHYSLIFGSPGESVASCERSIEFLEWTIQELGSQLDLVETDKYWLNYGSPASRVFRDYEHAVYLAGIAGKTISKDEWMENFASHAEELVVPWHVEKAWYQFFTHIDVETADEFNNRAASIMAKHTGSIRGRAYKPTA